MTAPSVSLPRTAARSTERRAARPRRSRGSLGLLAPFMIFYILFLVGPLLYDIVMSFFNTSLVAGTSTRPWWPSSSPCSP